MATEPTSGASRGQWVVCIRDLPSNTDEFLGPFHSEEKAEAVAERLRRDIAALSASHIVEAFTVWVRPASTELEEFRDELLADLGEMGYAPHANA